MSAILSPCGRYRYVLTRELPPPLGTKRPPPLVWVMLNPSTADAFADDATIRKCKAFASKHGYGGIVVVNLFAYRVTDPSVLREFDEKQHVISGPDNDAAIARETLGRNVVVGWGAHGDAFPDRVARVRELIEDATVVLCLGTTKSGQPKHPLYVPYDQPFIPWVK